MAKARRVSNDTLDSRFSAPSLTVNRVTDFNLANSASESQVSFDGQESGNTGVTWNGSNQATITKAGRYELLFQSMISNPTSTGFYLNNIIKKNGTNVVNVVNCGTMPAVSTVFSCVAKKTVRLQVGDVITFFIRQENTGTATRTISGPATGENTFACIQYVGE